MLYVVLATGGPGETGIEERFFQAQEQAQSFTVGSAGIHFIGLPGGPRCQTFESTRTDAVSLLGRAAAQRGRSLASKTGRGLVAINQCLTTPFLVPLIESLDKFEFI